MSKLIAPATRAAELEKALVLLDQVDLILNAETLAASEAGEPRQPHDYAGLDLTDMVTSVEWLRDHVAGARPEAEVAR